MNLDKKDYTIEEFYKEVESYGWTTPFTSIFNLAVLAHAYDNVSKDNWPFYGANAVHYIESMCEEYDGDLEKDFITGNSLFEASNKFIEYAREQLKKEF